MRKAVRHQSIKKGCKDLPKPCMWISGLSQRGILTYLYVLEQVEGKDVPQRLPAVISVVQLALLHDAISSEWQPLTKAIGSDWLH